MLGQVNWPRLAAKLSKIGVVLYDVLNSSAAGPFYVCLKTNISKHFGPNSKTETHSVLSIYGTRKIVRSGSSERTPCPYKEKSTKASLFCLNASCGRKYGMWK